MSPTQAPAAQTTIATALAAADHVAAEIERLIADGVFAPGQALPAERQLCERFGVSRAALREGLRLVRGRGLVRTEHGRGSFVAALVGDAANAPLLQLFASQPRTLYDLLEVRALLEGESARLAAIRGTDADFVMMARRYEELRAAHAQGVTLGSAEHARLDHAFHLSICEASHNPVLVHTLRSLTDLLLSSVFAAVANLYHRTPHRQQIDDHHARLYQAVLSRQPEVAQRAALDHLRGIRDSLREIEQDEQRLVRATMRLESRG